MRYVHAGSSSRSLSPRLRLCIGIAALAVLLAAPARTADAAKLSVVTTIAPLAMIVQDLGGDHVTATSLVSGATSVHTYEPSPSDLVRIAGADLLVSIGGELDGWLDKLLVGKKPGAIVLRLLEDGVPAAASHDPHVWLDPLWVRDRALASLVRGLSAMDPPTAPQYAASARRVADGLTDLDEDIRAILRGASVRGFLAFHPAWTWFAARFDLHPVGVVEESGGTEPSAGALAALLDTARAAGIRAILVEPQMDPRLARTVASEIGAGIVLVDPLGDLGSVDRSRYRDLMLFNASAFARAGRRRAAARLVRSSPGVAWFRQRSDTRRAASRVVASRDLTPSYWPPARRQPSCRKPRLDPLLLPPTRRRVFRGASLLRDDRARARAPSCTRRWLRRDDPVARMPGP